LYEIITKPAIAIGKIVSAGRIRVKNVKAEEYLESPGQKNKSPHTKRRYI
jgi:hypothetical protein